MVQKSLYNSSTGKAGSRWMVLRAVWTHLGRMRPAMEASEMSRERHAVIVDNKNFKKYSAAGNI
jgi:hypothetical protein